MWKLFQSIIIILKIFAKTSFSSEVEYRLNAFVELISVIGNLLGSIFILSLFYSSGSTLGGWEWNSSIVVLGIYIFLEGFIISLLQPSLTSLVKHVQNGTLDFILLKPMDTQFYLSSRSISPWGLPSIIGGFSLIIWGISLGSYNPTLIDLMMFLSTIVSSFIILYSLWFIIATTSIWFVKVWNATEVLRATLVAGRYPVSAYPSILRFLFTVILPITFLTTVPAQSVLGMSSISMTLSSLFLASIFFSISRIFWSFALRFYTSASS